MARDAGELREGDDFTTDGFGRVVFTRDYLARRGDCCGSGCQNCPFAWRRVPAVVLERKGVLCRLPRRGYGVGDVAVRE